MAKKYIKNGVIQADSSSDALEALQTLCEYGEIRNFYFNENKCDADDLPKKIDGLIDEMQILVVADKHTRNVRKYVDEEYEGNYYLFAARL